MDVSSCFQKAESQVWKATLFCAAESCGAAQLPRCGAMAMTVAHWLGLALVVLALHEAAAAASACGRIGWNAVAVLLTAPCNAAAGGLAGACRARAGGTGRGGACA